jgi:hypothetical protein
MDIHLPLEKHIFFIFKCLFKKFKTLSIQFKKKGVNHL